jgi:hypothetical protein
MLITFKKDAALINILSDLEIFLSDVADKLGISIKGLRTISLVDDSRKYTNWNKIESVDTSNYVKYDRYDIQLVNQSAKVGVPWRGYDPNKDISIKVFYNGKLLIPTVNYKIEAETADYGNVSGYVFNFAKYLSDTSANYLNGYLSVVRFSTKLPADVNAIDLGISRYDLNSIANQTAFAIPWGTLSDKDLYLEVYVNGELFRRESPLVPGTNTYSEGANHIVFAKEITGVITIIRHYKTT